MKVIVAKVSGFCGGVERTLNLMRSAIGRCSGQVYADGEIVHNGQVMKGLRADGVKMFRDCDSGHISADDCIVTRAHGISGDRCAQLQGCFKTIIDGTCPHLARMLDLVKKASGAGRNVLIIGDRGHPEVLALLAAAEEAKCFTVNSQEQMESLPNHLGKVLVVAQSTIDMKFFTAMANAIAAKYPDGEIRNTICESSRARQKAVLDLAEEGVQAIIVIGGKHSNNTAVLAKIARGTGLPVFRIEAAEELPMEELGSFTAIGIVSGASTSEEMVREVAQKLSRKKY
ncbi:MAG: 4-hydroxy-3-methylbut-2-enyl diphosphate reductase [Puniceicoccales bacterium]|jgi:4-hydroxy-3-methylbut-2-enyl diphosphate reductase|nr:4-hydroxy-3-methylbut-2-enyl diphosphate reductase [Puniceicoccales bacterium]